MDGATVTSAIGDDVGKTAITVTPAKASGNSYEYLTSASSITLPSDEDDDVSSYSAWDGTAEITAVNGHYIAIIEIDADDKIVRADQAVVVSKPATITFDLNGGNVGGVETDIEEDIHVGSVLLTPAPTAVYSGYTLTGWAYDEAGTEAVGAEDVVTANDTLYAVWAVIEYTLTYNLDGGDNHVDNPATFDVTDLPITLEDATKAEHTFNGWYDNVELTGDAVTSITVIGNEEVWAKFTGI